MALRSLRKRIGVSPLAVPDLCSLDEVPATWRIRLRWFPAIVRASAIVVLATGLAGWGTPWGETRLAGLDVFVLIDVSVSMQAQDVAPNRLGAALALARQVIARRPHDRFGVLLFAGDDALACPLTTDHAAVLARLSAVDAGPGTGTAIDTAVLGAVKRLPRERGTAVLLVVTDGISNAGAHSPRQAAMLARRENVRVFAASVGRTGAAPFPTEAGLIDVPTEVDEDGLRGMAEAADGVFVRAGHPDAATILVEGLANIPTTRLRPSADDSSVARRIGLLAALLLGTEIVVAVLILGVRS